MRYSEVGNMSLHFDGPIETVDGQKDSIQEDLDKMKPIKAYQSYSDPITLKSGKQFKSQKQFLNGYFNSKDRIFYGFQDYREDPIASGTCSTEFKIKFSEDLDKIESGEWIKKDE